MFDNELYESTLCEQIRGRTRNDFGNYFREILRRIASDAETAGFRARQAIEAGEGTEFDHERADLSGLVRKDALALSQHIRWMQAGNGNSDICRDAEYHARRVYRHATDMLYAGGIEREDHTELLSLIDRLGEQIAAARRIADQLARHQVAS